MSKYEPEYKCSICKEIFSTEEIKEHCKLCGLKINFFNFQNDFSEFKNELFELSTKDYLFQIDADEQIPPSLIHILRRVASQKK